MKIGLVKTRKPDVVWSKLSPATRFAFIGFGLVSLDAKGRPTFDDSVLASTVQKLEKSLGRP